MDQHQHPTRPPFLRQLATTSTSTDVRRARIDAIRDGALVREQLGQSALHKRLPNGSHQIIVGGRVFRAATLAEVVEAARAGGGGP